jgi:hypothetical protein
MGTSAPVRERTATFQDKEDYLSVARFPSEITIGGGHKWRARERRVDQAEWAALAALISPPHQVRGIDEDRFVNHPKRSERASKPRTLVFTGQGVRNAALWPRLHRFACRAGLTPGCMTRMC